MTLRLSRVTLIAKAVFAAAIALASTPAVAGPPLEYGLVPPPPYGFEGTTPDACAAEAAAFAALAGLAESFKEKELFSEALIDLQFQLHDCLDASEEREAPPADLPLPDRSLL